jgi:D-sedoheptulose 7-phosphate isomerase
MSIESFLRESASCIEAMATWQSLPHVELAIVALTQCAQANRPILVCGNGGSAADSMHIAGELVGRFLKERRAINCRSIAADPAILTAWSNDYEYRTVFSRQVEAYGEAGGVLLGLSTSGNSANICAAFEAAHARGMTTIGLTGRGGGRMAPLTDILIDVPSSSTPFIQQVHICLYHYMCQEVERRVCEP